MSDKISLAMDASQIEDYLTCPKLWYLKHVRQLQIKNADSSAMDKGTLMHFLLEHYYKYKSVGFPWMEAQLRSKKDYEENYPIFLQSFRFLKRSDLDYIKNRFLLYCIKYSNEDLKVYKKDHKAAVEIGFSIPLMDCEKYLFVLEGRIDLLADDKGQPFVVDHKTQSRKKSLYGNSVQFMTYAYAAKTNRVLVNYVGLQENVDKDELRRELHIYPPATLKRWESKLMKIFMRAATDLEMGEYEMNEAACPGKYGYPCEFTKVDEMISPAMQDIVILNQYEKRPDWHPWEIKENG